MSSDVKIRPIPGYESQYLIDTYGNVFSVNRFVPTGIGDKLREVGGNMVRPYTNKKNRQVCVKLNKNGKRSTHMISTLLKRTFGE
jgi:hypothetical protein